MDPTYKGLPTPLPTTQRPQGPNLRLVFILAGAFLLLIIILGLIFGAGRGGSTNDRQRLLYRLDALLTLTSGATSSLKDDELQKINAEMNLVLTSDQAAVLAVIPVAKTSKELAAIKTEETDAETTARLKTAIADGSYNATYTAVVQEKLLATYELAASVGSNAGAQTKAVLASLGEHLTIYSNQLQATN